MNLPKKIFVYRKLIPKAIWQMTRAHWQIHHSKFKTLNKTLGQPNKHHDYQPDELALSHIQKTSVVIQKIAPYFKFRCFAQAIAAQRLLKKQNIPSQLYLGVNKNEETLKAHAWLKCGELFVTGKKGHESFTSVICYTSA